MGQLGAIHYAERGKRVRWSGLRSALQQPEGEGEGNGKVSTGRGHGSRGEGRRGASGSGLIADRLLRLPPCVKAQMACFGWSEAPVS